jgi:methylated-DNA-protein-cysteine methyltransferase related protein
MNFFTKVYDQVSLIPKGKVATYGQIASMCGSPMAARQVGYAMAGLTTNEDNIPWWRVLNAKGYLSIRGGEIGIGKELQADALRSDGVEVSKDHNVNLKKYLWIP